MSRPYRLATVVDGSAYVEAPDGALLGRVDRLDHAVRLGHAEKMRGHLWQAVPNPLAFLEEPLRGLFPTRSAAAQALVEHHGQVGQ